MAAGSSACGFSCTSAIGGGSTGAGGAKELTELKSLKTSTAEDILGGDPINERTWSNLHEQAHLAVLSAFGRALAASPPLRRWLCSRSHRDLEALRNMLTVSWELALLERQHVGGIGMRARADFEQLTPRRRRRIVLNTQVDGGGGGGGSSRLSHEEASRGEDGEVYSHEQRHAGSEYKSQLVHAAVTLSPTTVGGMPSPPRTTSLRKGPSTYTPYALPKGDGVRMFAPMLTPPISGRRRPMAGRRRRRRR